MSQKYFSKLHMREHSNVIRIWSNKKASSSTDAHECPVFPVEGLNRIVLVCMCRIRQRLLTQAWERLTKATGVVHNYEDDIRTILSRKLPNELMRTELEIEVLYKWILQTKDLDPTGISSTIFSCKRKSAVFNALQQIRLEYYEPGEIVLYQGDFPRQEDGHFTILKGNCDIVQFPEDSVPLLKVLYYAKKKKWDDARKILHTAQILSKIHKYAGFGELATLTGVKRAASIRSSRKKNIITQILVLPKSALLECLSAKRGDSVEGAAPTEAIDFMRQSGLANRISPKDLVRAAGSMIKRNLVQGDILYFKGEKAKVLYLVVSGDILLDTGDIYTSNNIDGTTTTLPTPHPCLNANATNCYPLSQGSILGDEGASGVEAVFEATAMVVSEAAVAFEVVGFGLTFLMEKFQCIRYCALSYMERSKWQSAIPYAEELNPYTYFNSLRKCIAIIHPFRGTIENIYPEVKESSAATEQLKKSIFINSMAPEEKAIYNAAKIQMNNTNRGPGEVFKKPTIIETITAGTPTAAEKAKQKKKNVRLTYLLNNLEKAIDASNTGDMPSTPAPPVDPFANVSRKLNKIALNRALDINRVVKKILSNHNSASARDNILMDQINKLPPEVKVLDSIVDEGIFRKNIKDHRDREAAKAKQLQAEEAEKKAAAAAAVAAQKVKFFTTIFEEDKNKLTFSKSSANLNVTVPPDDENGSLDGKDKDGADTASHADIATPASASLAETPAASMERRLAISEQSRIDAYFHWIDRLTQQNFNHLVQQQTQSDIDKLTQMEKHGLVKQSLTELGVIFQQFDWMPCETPKNMTSEQRREYKKQNEGIGMAFFPLHFFGGRGDNKVVNRFAGFGMDDDDDRALDLITPDPHPHTIVPPIKIPKEEEDHPAKPAPLVKKNSVKMAKNDKKIANFKTYNVSSWREELIRKKAAALESLHKFHRCGTYSNRRIYEAFYVVPLPYQQHIVIANAQPNAPIHTHQPMGFNLMENGSVNSQTTQSGDMIRSVQSIAEKSVNDDSTFYNAEEQAEMYRELLRQNAMEMIKKYDAPDQFIEQVKAKEFPKRGAYLTDHAWNTRSMRMTNNARINDIVSYDPDKSRKTIRTPLRHEDSQSTIKLHLEGIRSTSASPTSPNDSSTKSPYSKPMSPMVKPMSPMGKPLSPDTISTNRSRPFVEELDMHSIHSNVTSATENHILRTLTDWKEDVAVPTPDNASLGAKQEDTEREYMTLETTLLNNLGFAPPNPGDDGISGLPTMDNTSRVEDGLTRGMTPMTITENLSTPHALETPKTDGEPTVREESGREKKLSEIELKMMAMKQHLITGRPDSVALEMYKNYVNTPVVPRYTEGKKFANDNSKFKLPVKLGGEVKEIESDKESHIIMEERKKFEIALFNSVYGKNGDTKPTLHKEQRKLLNAYVNRSLTSHKNSSIQTSETSTEKGSRPTSPVPDKQTQDRLNALKQLAPDFDPDAEDAPIHEKDDYELDMEELESWQRYTIGLVLKEKNSEKKTLPVLTSKSLNLGKKFAANRARRWGSGSMVRIPAVAEEEPIDGPSSYLDVYKTNFKLRSSIKDREKMAKKLKAEKTVF